MYSCNSHHAVVIGTLSKASKDGYHPSDINIELLPEQLRGSFTERTFMKIICDMLRLEDQLCALKDFMRHVSSAEDLNNNFYWSDDTGPKVISELWDLSVLLFPMNADVTDETLAACKSKFETNKSLCLHKPLTLFPTGRDCLNEVADALLGRRHDEGFNTDLEIGLSQMKSFDMNCKLTLELEGDGGVVIPDVDNLKAVVQSQSRILVGATERFSQANKKSLDFIEPNKQEFLKKVTDMVQGHLDTCANEVLQTFVDAYSATSQTAMDEAVKQFTVAVKMANQASLNRLKNCL